MPEPLNFLHGLLFLARDEAADVDLGKVIPPCRPVGKHNRLLMIDGAENMERDEKDEDEATETNASKESFKLTLAHIPVDSKKKSKSSAVLLSTSASKSVVVRQAVKLLTRYRKLYADLPAVTSIFLLSRYFLSKLPDVLRDDDDVRSLIQACGGGGETAKDDSVSGSSISAISTIIKKPTRLTRLSRPKPRPQPLPQFEPKFDMDFDGRKRFAGDQERKDQLRLQRQYKMEFKAAAKDLRQDAAFLANVKISEQIAKDKKRDAKVKEIYGHLSTQEGEHKEMERQKKRK